MLLKDGHIKIPGENIAINDCECILLKKPLHGVLTYFRFRGTVFLWSTLHVVVSYPISK